MGRKFLRKNIEFAKHATKNSVGDVFNQPKTSTGPVCIFPEEWNPIGSVVTEILSFRRTERHHSTFYYRYDAVASTGFSEGGINVRIV